MNMIIITCDEGEACVDPPTILLLTTATTAIVITTSTNDMRIRAPRIGINLSGFLDSNSGFVASCFSPDLVVNPSNLTGCENPFWETDLTSMTKSEEGGRSTRATFGSVVVTFRMLRW